MTHMADLNQLRQKAFHEMRSVLDTCTAQKRDLTVEENTRYAALEQDLNDLDEKIGEHQESERRAHDATTYYGNLDAKPVTGYRAMSEADKDLDRRFRDAILNRNLAPIETNFAEKRSGYKPGVEMRTALGTSGNVGTTFGSNLMTHLVESTSVLAAGATVMGHGTGEPFKYPKSTADSTAVIVGEGAQIGESEPTLSSVTLGAFKYGHLVEVTYELANDVTFDLIGHLAFESGRAIGHAFGTHSVTGGGTTVPRGILTDASLGITGTTGTGTGEFTGDDLIGLYHSLASPYARSASSGWLMNQKTLGLVRKLKATGTGNYLFDVSVPVGSAVGASGMLLGRPVYVSDAMSDVAVSAKSVLFADFSRYVVRQVGGIRFERSNDFHFDTDVVTFRALSRLDGALIDTTGAAKYFVGKSS